MESFWSPAFSTKFLQLKLAQSLIDNKRALENNEDLKDASKILFAEQIHEKFSEFKENKEKVVQDVEYKISRNVDQLKSAEMDFEEKVLLQKTDLMTHEILPKVSVSSKCSTIWEEKANFDKTKKDIDSFSAIMSSNFSKKELGLWDDYQVLLNKSQGSTKIDNKTYLAL